MRQAPTPTADTAGEARARRRQILVVGTGLLLVVFLLGRSWLGGASGVDATRSAAARAALARAGCTLRVVKALPNAIDHSDVPTPDAAVKWNTFPPTNGPHYRVPVVFGAYDEPLQQARVVHNLEHGGVSIQYGREVPAATVARLRAFYGRHENGTLLAPLPELRGMIALGAWVARARSLPGGNDRGEGYLATCDSFDEAAFGAYFAAYQFKGPEHFPESALAPGS
jgi:hypothetical protein